LPRRTITPTLFLPPQGGGENRDGNALSSKGRKERKINIKKRLNLY